MRRDELLALLAAHQSKLHEMKVERLLLFGPVSRDEATTDECLDLYAEVQRPFTLFDLARVELFLEDLLGRPVLVITPGGVSADERERILREGVRAA
jgi:predicted nucleotidyltransferase